LGGRGGSKRKTSVNRTTGKKKKKTVAFAAEKKVKSAWEGDDSPQERKQRLLELRGQPMEPEESGRFL